MTIKPFYPHTESPQPSQYWLSLSESQRIDKLNQVICQKGSAFNCLMSVVAAKNDGQVVVKLLRPLAASARGTLLLDFEEALKNHIDAGLTVWGEAIGDKNSLRNLRGIEVKTL